VLILSGGYFLLSNQPSAPSQEYTHQLPASASADDNAFFQKYYSKTLNACFGLKKHAGALELIGVSRGYRDALVFKVNDQGSGLPNEWLARGHSCYFEVDSSSNELVISKEPCQSLCLNQLVKPALKDTDGQLRIKFQ
jgi:hypothetical protein